MAKLLHRRTFDAVALVPLLDWGDLDAATVWCAAEFDRRQLRWRRAADPNVRYAQFEFADATQAVEFKLRFG